MTEPDFSAIGAFTRGDPEQARRLRGILATLLRRTDDEELRRVIRSVLDGRENVRAVFRHPVFNEMARRSFDNFAQGLARLTPEERERALDPARRGRTPQQEVDRMLGL